MGEDLAPDRGPTAAPQAPAASAAVCANHPSRPAVGRCPACRKAVCDECHVRLDGILHCRACLQAQARRMEKTGGSGVPGRALTSVAAAAALLVAFVAAERMLTLASFLGGRATNFWSHMRVTEVPPAETGGGGSGDEDAGEEDE